VSRERDLEVRVASPDEAEEVARLLGGFRDYYGEELPAQEVLLATVRRLGGDPGTEFLLAGDPACGFAQLRFRLSAWTGTDDAWLEDVFVEPDARGRGVGRALAEACVERARARGCKRIQLDANERNAAALALYHSLGFASGSPRRWNGGRDLYLTRRL
jgi:ribosomal protein S18 acetylase RimI-like enzyme